MIEKIGAVKNPLTIIAIFAGIAEVSGTSVLPFITKENQSIFIWFLVAFPIALIVLFFVTLNFNNKALYAPSDFNNEENYVKIFKYDDSRQQKVEIAVSQDDLLKKLYEEFEEFKKRSVERLSLIETELNGRESIERQKEHMLLNNDFFVYISNFADADAFSRLVLDAGYRTKIYVPFVEIKPDGSIGAPYKSPFLNEEHKAIWLGSRVPLQMAKDIIKLSVEKYPFLSYIQVSNFGPEYIFVGGATEGTKNLKPLSLEDLKTIHAFQTIQQLHNFLSNFDFSAL